MATSTCPWRMRSRPSSMACPPEAAGAAGAERRTLDAALDADMRGGGRADVAHERQRMRGRLLELEDVAIGDLEVDDAGLGRADDAGGPIWIGERVGEARLPDASSAAAAANRL